jgi:hypothetical protein
MNSALVDGIDHFVTGVDAMNFVTLGAQQGCGRQSDIPEPEHRDLFRRFVHEFYRDGYPDRRRVEKTIAA